MLAKNRREGLLLRRLVGEEVDVLVCRLTVGVGNAFRQYGVRGNTVQCRLLIRLVNHHYPLLLQLGYLVLSLLRYQCTLGNDQHLIAERLVQQGVLVHRVVLVTMQRINPVLQVNDACRVPYTDGRLLHRLSDIGKALLLRGYTLSTKQSWQHRYKAVGSQCTTGHFLPGKYRNIDYRLALL